MKDKALYLGENIKQLREKFNLSLSELSKKTGISKSFLQKLENGKASYITFEQLNSLCVAFSVLSINELFGD